MTPASRNEVAYDRIAADGTLSIPGAADRRVISMSKAGPTMFMSFERSRP